MLIALVSMCVCCALLVKAERDDFEETLHQFEALAVAALERGQSRHESVAELGATELGRTSLFHDVYPVVFARMEQTRTRRAPTRRDEI